MGQTLLVLKTQGSKMAIIRIIQPLMLIQSLCYTKMLSFIELIDGMWHTEF